MAAQKERGERMLVIASVWTPPHYMKRGAKLLYHNNDSAKGKLIPTEENLTNYARYMAAAVKAWEKAFGVPIYALSIQNEPLFEMEFSSMKFEFDLYAKALVRVKEELVRNRMKTKFFGPEHVGYGKPGDFWLIDQQVNYLKAMVANGKAVKYIDAFAIHGYGGDGVDSDGGGEEFWRRYWDYARRFGKPSWQTETGGGEHRWQSLKGRGKKQGPLNFAVAIIDGMTIGDVSLWCNWQFYDGGNATEHNLLGKDWDTGNPKYSVAKHFFRYVRPGAVRLGVTGDDARSLKLAVWRHGADGTYVLLGVNLGDTQRIELGLPGGISRSSGAAGFVTDARRSFADLAVAMTAKKAAFTMPSESVVTVVLSGRKQRGTGGTDSRTSSSASARVRPSGPKKAGAETTAAWDAKLIGRLVEECAAGRKPRFYLQMARSKARVVSADEDGSLRVVVSRPRMELDMQWSRLTLADKKSLAIAVVREGTPEDHCLAAFYLLVSGEKDAADEHLYKGGEGADEVRSVFE